METVLILVIALSVLVLIALIISAVALANGGSSEHDDNEGIVCIQGSKAKVGQLVTQVEPLRELRQSSVIYETPFSSNQIRALSLEDGGSILSGVTAVDAENPAIDLVGNLLTVEVTTVQIIFCARVSADGQQTWFSYMQSAFMVHVDGVIYANVAIDDLQVYFCFLGALSGDFSQQPIDSAFATNFNVMALSLDTGVQAWAQSTGTSNTSEGFAKVSVSESGVYIGTSMDIVGGYTDFNSTVVPANPAITDTALIVAKLNKIDGSQQWYHVAGGIASSFIIQVEVTSNEDVIVVGSISSSPAFVTFDHSITTEVTGDFIAFVAKLSKDSGEQLWMAHLNAVGDSFFGSFTVFNVPFPKYMALDANDNVIISASLQSDEDAYGFDGQLIPGLADFSALAVVAAKLDGNTGEQVWIRWMGSHDNADFTNNFAVLNAEKSQVVVGVSSSTPFNSTDDQPLDFNGSPILGGGNIWVSTLDVTTGAQGWGRLGFGPAEEESITTAVELNPHTGELLLGIYVRPAEQSRINTFAGSVAPPPLTPQSQNDVTENSYSFFVSLELENGLETTVQLCKLVAEANMMGSISVNPLENKLIVTNYLNGGDVFAAIGFNNELVRYPVIENNTGMVRFVEFAPREQVEYLGLVMSSSGGKVCYLQPGYSAIFSNTAPNTTYYYDIKSKMATTRITDFFLGQTNAQNEFRLTSPLGPLI